MQELALSQATTFHAIIAVCLLLIAFANLCALIFMRDSDINFTRLNRLSWVLTPLFIGFLFIIFLSGFSVWAMIQFAWSAKIALMICANFMFVLEIFRIKKLRTARMIPAKRGEYIRFSRIANAIYVAIILYFLVF